MQIRKQLRAMANAFATDRQLTLGANGYQGKHSRVRFKAQKGPGHRGSGTAPRHTKKKGGGAGQ